MGQNSPAASVTSPGLEGVWEFLNAGEAGMAGSTEQDSTNWRNHVSIEQLNQKKRELEVGAARLKMQITAAKEQLDGLQEAYQQQLGAVKAIEMLIHEHGETEAESASETPTGEAEPVAMALEEA